MNEKRDFVEKRAFDLIKIIHTHACDWNLQCTILQLNFDSKKQCSLLFFWQRCWLETSPHRPLQRKLNSFVKYYLLHQMLLYGHKLRRSLLSLTDLHFSKFTLLFIFLQTLTSLKEPECFRHCQYLLVRIFPFLLFLISF